MISTFLIVFVFMAIVVGFMAVGIMFGRKPIAGSCGGMAAVGMESECDVCGGDKSKCDKEEGVSVETPKGVFSYDATKPKD